MEKLQGICLVNDNVFLSIKYHVDSITSLVQGVVICLAQGSIWNSFMSSVGLCSQYLQLEYLISFSGAMRRPPRLQDK